MMNKHSVIKKKNTAKLRDNDYYRPTENSYTVGDLWLEADQYMKRQVSCLAIGGALQ
jgi:hypothetical protein